MNAAVYAHYILHILQEKPFDSNSKFNYYAVKSATI